ncbi:hypothetical protein BGZ61DRAFT_459109 [Ilyonectria robusta]|uniref:uncharacterized protein n=1 Tax=Ilyonectria robusta TaxID=1079257 RepID=UPI001E8EAAD0|nr:uncharacterized protein BGZ61DRAFT_459109 [Ilyonectria robusta]KAH8672257.1 hypothetical protein BGZ61DRAFT_459109 [Ilyonectria robusta]
MPTPYHFSSSRATTTPTQTKTDASKNLPYRPTPTISQQRSQSCHLSSSPAPDVGTKRSRPRRTRTTPVDSHWPRGDCSACCHHNKRLSSEDECDDGFEGADSDSDAEESCCGDDNTVVHDYVWPKDHEFQEARQLLLQQLRQNVKVFAENTQYHEPPKHQPPPPKRKRKRPRPSKRQSKPTDVFDELNNPGDQEHTDDGFIILPRKYLRFPCPFYKANPKRHRNCLLQHDLRRIEDVATHVVRHHRRPSYCPTCSRTFASVIDCDRHMMARTCELRDLVIPEGINLYQKNILTQKDDEQLTTTERWERMYATTLPDAKSSPSPFLNQGCAQAISAARDYWREDGWRCVSDFLRNQGMLEEVQEDDERAQVALFNSTLEDLLTEIMDEYEQASNQ